MPSHSLHRKVCLWVLGETFRDVDRVLDLPGIAGVRRHRRFFHKPFEAWAIGYALHGEKGALAGLLHVVLDAACNDKVVRKLMEAAFK